MTPDEACFDHSDFTNFRARLDRLDVTKKFSDKIVQMSFGHGLISEEHFSIDGSLLQSHASLKSLKHIEGIFGWLKQFGGLRRAMVVGRWKIQQFADTALCALNLVRMSKLLAT